MPVSTSPSDLTQRLAHLVERGRALEAEGLPFPTDQLATGVQKALDSGALEQAIGLLKRGESLYTVAARDWGWVRETLERADELRTLAGEIGVDVQHLDNRVGNPREQLRSQPLSAQSLGRAAASASLAVAVLTDTIPKFCVQEAQKLGESIRTARNRGEDVTQAVVRFSKLLASIQDHQIVQTARLLVDVRKAVARIPRAPTVSVPTEEEEEILIEARNLARRIQRIKTKARNAQGAARLMTQVRAALSEERRTGTPEEEIEALWAEVDQLTKEHGAEPAGPAIGDASPFATEETGDIDPDGAADTPTDPDSEPLVPELPLTPPSRRSRASR